MTEKENPPVKQRKLKKIDDYIEVIPRAWKIYQHELANGVDPRKAELRAVKIVYPGDKNSSTTLRIWGKYRLWPPSPEILAGKSSGEVAEEEARIQKRNGLAVISGGGKKRLKALKNHAENGYSDSELSEKEILKLVRNILDKIEVHHKEWTGGRMKKYSLIKTRVFAGRLPVDLLNEIHKFKGSNTYHLEKALRLYVMVMGTKH